MVGRFEVLLLQNVPYHLIGLKSIVAMFTGCIGHGISPQSAMRSQVSTSTEFAKWSSKKCLYFLFFFRDLAARNVLVGAEGRVKVSSSS